MVCYDDDVLIVAIDKRIIENSSTLTISSHRNQIGNGIILMSKTKSKRSKFKLPQKHGIKMLTFLSRASVLVEKYRNHKIKITKNEFCGRKI